MGLYILIIITFCNYFTEIKSKETLCWFEIFGRRVTFTPWGLTTENLYCMNILNNIFLFTWSGYGTESTNIWGA